ncbi:MAG: hypothetical protein WCK59_03605 [Candidatus Falkowbacteria bacterium]
MIIKIKIKPKDELKIKKSGSSITVPVSQIHQNKKAYKRRVKHQQKDYND